MYDCINSSRNRRSEREKKTKIEEDTKGRTHDKAKKKKTLGSRKRRNS